MNETTHSTIITNQQVMKITVRNVEGNTARKGVKQNQIYENITPSQTEGFYDAINSNGKTVTLWNVNKDWSLLGIMMGERGRMSYTKEFTIE